MTQKPEVTAQTMTRCSVMVNTAISENPALLQDSLLLNPGQFLSLLLIVCIFFSLMLLCNSKHTAVSDRHILSKTCFGQEPILNLKHSHWTCTENQLKTCPGTSRERISKHPLQHVAAQHPKTLLDRNFVGSNLDSPTDTSTYSHMSSKDR